jgi:hypothetical protein
MKVLIILIDILLFKKYKIHFRDAKKSRNHCSHIKCINEITNLTMIADSHHLLNIYMHYSDSIQIYEVEAQNLIE